METSSTELGKWAVWLKITKQFQFQRQATRSRTDSFRTDASVSVQRSFSLAGNSFRFTNFSEMQMPLGRIIINLFIDSIQSLGLSQKKGFNGRKQEPGRQIFSILTVLRAWKTILPLSLPPL